MQWDILWFPQSAGFYLFCSLLIQLLGFRLRSTNFPSLLILVFNLAVSRSPSLRLMFGLSNRLPPLLPCSSPLPFLLPLCFSPFCQTQWLQGEAVELCARLDPVSSSTGPGHQGPSHQPPMIACSLLTNPSLLWYRLNLLPLSSPCLFSFPYYEFSYVGDASLYLFAFLFFLFIYFFVGVFVVPVCLAQFVICWWLMVWLWTPSSTKTNSFISTGSSSQLCSESVICVCVCVQMYSVCECWTIKNDYFDI